MFLSEVSSISFVILFTLSLEIRIDGVYLENLVLDQFFFSHIHSFFQTKKSKS